MWHLRNVIILLCFSVSVLGLEKINVHCHDWQRLRDVYKGNRYQTEYKCSIVNFELPNDREYYFDRQVMITSLEIKDSTISNIPGALLKILPDLETFLVTKTTLKNVNQINCEELKELDLSSNAIISFDENAFYNCQNLKALNLSHNAIPSLTKPLFKPGKHIKKLDLSNNKITELSGDVLKEVEIEKLILHSNLLENFNMNQFNGQSCELLNISYNNLKSFNVSGDILKKNLTLSLQFNKLTKLDVKNLNVKFLDVFNNKIESLAMEGSCQKLNAQNNLISDLTLGTSVLSLQEINLSHNKLGNLQDICKCTNLIELNLDDNLIDNIGSCFYQLTKLKKLSLRKNYIYHLFHDEFNERNIIQHLNLAFNRLEAFDESVMSVFKNLQYLDLSGNQISDISDNLNTWMSNLNQIGLSHNKFKCSRLFMLMNKIKRNGRLNIFIDKTLPVNATNIDGIQCYRYSEGELLRDSNGSDVARAKLDEKFTFLSQKLNNLERKFNDFKDFNETIQELRNSINQAVKNKDISNSNNNLTAIIENLSESIEKNSNSTDKKFEYLENIVKNHSEMLGRSMSENYHSNDRINDELLTNPKYILQSDNSTNAANYIIIFLLAVIVFINLFVILKRFDTFGFRRRNERENESALTNFSTM
ncbi:toll-like receptor 3 [Lutzomyia longipalpis]|uniref:toll-like receptor 3 n=1 Tax=Lutzomyia longipalpis TaxID=7200 RepID=UPI0024844749|nr:toll-like receptor 3 [Lutzomyia longipalpis]